MRGHVRRAIWTAPDFAAPRILRQSIIDSRQALAPTASSPISTQSVSASSGKSKTTCRLCCSKTIVRVHIDLPPPFERVHARSENPVGRRWRSIGCPWRRRTRQDPTNANRIKGTRHRHLVQRSRPATSALARFVWNRILHTDGAVVLGPGATTSRQTHSRPNP